MKTLVIVTALIKYKDKYLIAKRAPEKRFSPNQWEFISGFIEEKEPAEETIIREIKEETYLKGKIVATSSPFTLNDSEARWIVVSYLVSVEPYAIKLNPEDHSEYCWATRKELAKYRDLHPYIDGFKEVKLLS